MRSSSCLLAIVLLSFCLSCGEDPPPTAPPVPPDPGAGEPEIGAVVETRVTVPGPVTLVIPGRHLDQLAAARLVDAGQNGDTGIPTLGIPDFSGDTLARVIFDILPSLPNSLYNLRLQFGEPPDAAIRLVPSVVTVARPLPVIDSFIATPVLSSRELLDVEIYGERLAGLDSVVLGSAVARVSSVESGQLLSVVDSLLDIRLAIGPEVPTGVYDMTVGFHGTSEAVAKRFAFPASVQVGALYPPVLDSFALTTTMPPWIALTLRGTNMSLQTSGIVVPGIGTPSGAPLPQFEIAGWDDAVGQFNGGPWGWLTVGEAVPLGTYDVVATEAGLADTLHGVLTIVPDYPLAIGDTLTVTGVLVARRHACFYWWDWWGDYAEPCVGTSITVLEPGQLTLSLEFTPEDCNPYGGLWMSVDYGGEDGYYLHDCAPISNASVPYVVTDPGTVGVTVGLHATPGGWLPDHPATYTLTMTYAPAGAAALVQAQPIARDGAPASAPMPHRQRQAGSIWSTTQRPSAPHAEQPALPSP